MKIGFLTTITVLLLVFSRTAHAHAAGYGQGMYHSPAPAVNAGVGKSLQLKLFTPPDIVQVGQRVTISVAAPIPSSVRVSFHSLHHSFSGTALYQAASRAYAISVRLVVKTHGTEPAQVIATVTPRATRRTYHLFGRFLIRGQAMGMSGIPQGNRGDADGDNNGGASDGDGNR